MPGGQAALGWGMVVPEPIYPDLSAREITSALPGHPPAAGPRRAADSVSRPHVRRQLGVRRAVDSGQDGPSRAAGSPRLAVVAGLRRGMDVGRHRRSRARGCSGRSHSPQHGGRGPAGRPGGAGPYAHDGSGCNRRVAGAGCTPSAHWLNSAPAAGRDPLFSTARADADDRSAAITSGRSSEMPSADPLSGSV